MNFHPLLIHLQKDAPEYTALLGLLFVAAIANMPKPEVIANWLGVVQVPATTDAVVKISWWLKFKQIVAIGYKWIYDTLQAFMAARSPHPQQPSKE